MNQEIFNQETLDNNNETENFRTSFTLSPFPSRHNFINFLLTLTSFYIFSLKNKLIIPNKIYKSTQNTKIFTRDANTNFCMGSF